MRDYILFMHADTEQAQAPELWDRYFETLRDRDAFGGGSSIGPGEILRKDGAPRDITAHLTGYIRVRAADMAEARSLVAGNPVYECGGSVEIRELPTY